MNKFRGAALLSFGLCGCITVGSMDLQRREPVAVFQTEKSAGELIRCLTERINNYGEPNVVTTDRQTTLSFINMGTAQLVFAIAPGGNVRVWRVTSLVPYQNSVEACR